MMDMSGKLIFIVCFFVLYSSLLNVNFVLVKAEATNECRVHNIDTGLNYTSIQEAIDSPRTLEGHTIFVQEGTYYENVILDRSNLTLVGENMWTTVIDGDRKNVVSLKANSTRIKGFTIQNGYHGILMSPWTHGHIISGNVVVNNDYGISGHYDCTNVSIWRNIIISNNIAGIEMLFSNSVISNNLISDNGRGEFQQYSSGIQVVIGVNSKTIYCINNTITGNTIRNHRIGIWAIRHSEENIFAHNNFINNSKHISVLATPWNNSVAENYWSDYDGTDRNNDGIGDTPHIIDDTVQDRHPLMGMFHSFNTSLGHQVNVISNSTIENFEYSELRTMIRMHVSSMNENQTHGFCRICIPHSLMNVHSITVIIDDELSEVLCFNDTIRDNGTHRWIYFAYQHSTHKIDIISESKLFLVMPLFIIVILPTIITQRRKHRRAKLRKSCRNKGDTTLLQDSECLVRRSSR